MGSVSIDDDFFDGDIDDQCHDEALNRAAEIKKCNLYDKITFLVQPGFSVDKLKETIEEEVKNDGEEEKK